MTTPYKAPSNQHTPRLPDRTAMLVSPGIFFIAGAIFAALLVGEALRNRAEDRGEKVMVEMLRSLVDSIGTPATFVIAGALVVGLGVWLAITITRYRGQVAADRRAAGLN